MSEYYNRIETSADNEKVDGMKVVIIDNYDSFTYNLAHLVKELGAEVTVYRNDRFQLNQLETFDKIILSPGPGIPSEAGLLLDVIKHYAGRKFSPFRRNLFFFPLYLLLIPAMVLLGTALKWITEILK